MTLQAVNELIASLESAGELSIKEQKFLKLAKAFKQLAAENVALKEEISNITFMRDDDFFGSTRRAQEVMGRLVNVKTTATDRIVAGIKADGVEEFIGRLQQCVDEGDFIGDEVDVIVGAIDCGKELCEQLREGADK
ncbi:TPA: hypothetical protein ME607_002507 [Klebsiella pneumoniae]|nr:hypothetical protein [Klebsiella pneumoniae]HBW4737415.1 hypothetical protein [Klebsiella pneumoniae]HBW4810324.1 hypothetical protein [Klebsiella pneumoniae]HBW4914468.1 hypothetical protein [Klebsiella pneumoniae]HBW5053005.1 hypothetical protein [Klebsiella pneumoniae]